MAAWAILAAADFSYTKFLLGNMTRFLFLILALAIGTPLAATAQWSIGADVVSRYIWRGFDFGESASFQPALAFSSGGFEIGSWASYSVSADGASGNEHDLYAVYSIDMGSESSLGLGVTDYYFPAPDGADWGNFDGDGEGAHWIELMASYTGPSNFPVSLMGAMMVHNDPDGSLYLEASYPVSAPGVDLGITLGMAANESAFYGVESFSLINFGISASKDLSITENFALPLSVSYILNPTHERSHLVFGISIFP